jgi:hypothetical protein
MPPRRERTTLRTNVEFVDMRLPQYANAVRALRNSGFVSKRMTSGTRREITNTYYNYLVAQKSMELGRQLMPRELEELHRQASDNIEYYEMYIKQTRVPVSGEMEENVEVNLPEEFATEEEVERMQNNYAMMSNLANRMRATTITNFPREMPQSSFAQSLLLDPQYRLENWYNYRRAQGMKNSNNDSGSDDMDGGRRRNKHRKTRKHNKKSRKTRRRVTRYRKRA